MILLLRIQTEKRTDR